MSTFRVGQKVVCVPIYGLAKGPDSVDGSGASFPEAGSVYTIRAIVFCSYDGSEALLLCEVVNKPQRGLEPGFDHIHFKPVAYPKQSETSDIDLFLPLLAPVERA